MSELEGDGEASAVENPQFDVMPILLTRILVLMFDGDDVPEGEVQRLGFA